MLGRHYCVAGLSWVGWKNYESVAMYILYHIVMYKSIPLVIGEYRMSKQSKPTQTCFAVLSADLMLSNNVRKRG